MELVLSLLGYAGCVVAGTVAGGLVANRSRVAKAAPAYTPGWRRNKNSRV